MVLAQLTPPISEKDAKIIADVVELFAPKVYTETEYQDLKVHIIKIFGTDITPDHYIMLGQIIGLKTVTDKHRHQKSNLLHYGKRHN